MNQTQKLGFAVLTLSLSMSAHTPSPHSGSSAQETYTDVKILTAQAQDQAGKLSASIAAANFAPAFARERLQSLRQDLNAIGQKVDQLLAARQFLPTPEKEALDKAIPVLQDAAHKIQSAIRAYNESAHTSWFLRNRELSKGIQADIERAHDILASGQKLESTIERENRAATKFQQFVAN